MALQDVRDMGVSVELDRLRTLRYDLNAFAALEDHFGNVEKAFAALQQGSLKAARTLLWVGLLHEDDALTERQAGAMVTMENMNAIMEAISIALGAAVPQGNAHQQEAMAKTDPR